MRRNTNTMGVRHLCISLCTFLFAIQCVFSTVSFTQTWTMPVDGKVYGGGEKLAGAIVTLFKNGQQLQQIVTTANGRFSFELPANAEYIISVTKPGYINKRFKINTGNVPADRAEAGGFNPFEPDVTLFEMPTAPEISKRVEAILSQPIAIYQYNLTETNFNYDEKYTSAIQEKLLELAQLQKQAEKEVADKVKNAALEAQKQLEIDKQYKAAIAKADAAFTAADYPTAKSGYNEALTIKTGEAYPKTKLAEIDKLIANAGKQKEIDAKYQAAITKGDGALGTKDYASAKTAYTEASGIKPTEAYPKTKLAEIDKLLAEGNKQKELDAKYQVAITKADGSFGSKDYTLAKASYTEASGIKPSEAYPKTKLAEIDKLLAEGNKQKEMDAKYQAAITKGDASFSTKEYASAKSAYTEASGIKPTEAYPKSKIAEIDKLLAASAKAGELEKQYKDLITKADGFFSQKDYSSARGSYSDASSLKSAEQYPKTKITEIDKLLAEISQQKSSAEKEQQYKDALAKADKLFTSKEYSSSKSAYNEALAVKPSEQYPKTKIEEIDKLLAENGKQKELDAKYQAAITQADGSFGSKDYTSAKAAYTEASGIKPNEAYPKTKLAEIDKLLANAAAASLESDVDAKYKATIVKGDKAFTAKDYVTARPMYIEASRIKVSEQYPKDKIAEIDALEKILAATKEKDESDLQYKQAITRADKSFSQKDYNSSKLGYEDALTYKPDEKYPQDRIKLINEIITKSQTVAQPVTKEVKQAVAAVVAEEDKVKVYQNELRTKYPAGVTEEEYSNNGKVILRRVVIKSDFAGVYTKVTHNWGGIYCFRDNTPVTEVVFENETR